MNLAPSRDDTAIIADNPEALQRLLNKIVEGDGDNFFLKTNTKKAKVTIVSKTRPPGPNIQIYEDTNKVVPKFKYLGI